MKVAVRGSTVLKLEDPTDATALPDDITKEYRVANVDVNTDLMRTADVGNNDSFIVVSII